MGAVIPWEDLLRLLAAAVAGGVIGLERELHDKPAGARTNMMICLGAAFFTILSQRIAAPDGDPARIAAQIVTGVGFLGAGAIMHARGAVHGLTTAATIWVVAATGIAFGAGQYVLGAVVAASVAIILIVMGVLRGRLLRERAFATFRVQLAADADSEQSLRGHLDQLGLACESWQISKTHTGIELQFLVEGPLDHIERLQRVLLDDQRVRTFERR